MSPLDGAVLERNRTVRAGGDDAVLLGQQNHMGSVDATNIGPARVELVEEATHMGRHVRPCGAKEAGPEAVRPRSAPPVHGIHRGPNLRIAEGGDERAEIGPGCVGVEGIDVEVPGRLCGRVAKIKNILPNTWAGPRPPNRYELRQPI
jgi:hypothetical protein